MRKSTSAAKATSRAIREDMNEAVHEMCHKLRGAACRIHGCFQLAQMEPESAAVYVSEGLRQTNALLDMIDSRVAELQALLNEPDN